MWTPAPETSQSQQLPQAYRGQASHPHASHRNTSGENSGDNPRSHNLWLLLQYPLKAGFTWYSGLLACTRFKEWIDFQVCCLWSIKKITKAWLEILWKKCVLEKQISSEFTQMEQSWRKQPAHCVLSCLEQAQISLCCEHPWEVTWLREKFCLHHQNSYSMYEHTLKISDLCIKAIRER